MADPVITAVIPTYRRPALLRRAIRSVLDQTFREFRLCVYDNASGDETPAVVEEFRKQDPRVEYVGRPSNVGAYWNWTDAGNRVKTPFFSFLPDDDVLLPHFFETALQGFERYPDAALSILSTLLLNPNGLIVGVTNHGWREGLLSPPEGMLSTLHLGNPGLQGMLIRKSVWDEYGGFDQTTNPAAEYDFDLHVMASRSIVLQKTPGAIQVLHADTFTAVGGLNWVWPCLPRIIEKLRGDRSLPPEVRQQGAEGLSRVFRKGLVTRGVLQSIANGNWPDAERAVDILEQECGLTTRAGILRRATSIARRVPGAGRLMRGAFTLRSLQKTIRSLPLQWRFRSYLGAVTGFHANGTSSNAARGTRPGSVAT